MERRQRRRIQIHRDFDSSLDLRIDGVSHAGGHLCEYHSRGLAVKYPLDRAPRLEPGRSVELCIRVDGQSAHPPLRAVVAGRVSEGGHLRFGFELAGRSAELVEVLHGAFNRRSSFRVSPPHETPIAVTLETTDGDSSPVEARLLDISPAGLALVMGSPTDEPWIRGEEVALSLTLPVAAGELRILGTTRYRCAAGQRTRLGIEFDAARTPGFKAMEKAILEYVMERQRQLLERGLG